MAITKEELRQFAYDQGLDLFGVANIERFDNAPVNMSPKSIFPRAKSVIVVGKRIMRGGWRGIEEGTNWVSYSYFNYHGLLNTHFIQLPMYELACKIEDYGYEAVPYYSGVPERQEPCEPTREGEPSPNVHLAIRIAGTAAGLGECGWSKVFLTKKFGPRQRLHAIITDMELEPDPLVEPNSICTRCMHCVSGCPGAIPHIRENKYVEIQIEDKKYRWGDVDMGKCTLMYHGGDPRTSPFIHKDFPGMKFEVTEQTMTESEAYKFAWTLSLGNWVKTDEFPHGRIIEGHSMLRDWSEAGSFGVEGSRGCMRSCFNYLEKQKLIEQTFHGGDFIKRPRWLLSSGGDRTHEE
jgi:ferredoxin